MKDELKAWSCYETIGISIPNGRAVTRTTIPSDLTDQQMADLEAWIDRINAEADKEEAL